VFLIAILMVGFLWLGLSAKNFDRATQIRLLALVAGAVAVDFLRGVL
jgi:hypothetical protein